MKGEMAKTDITFWLNMEREREKGESFFKELTERANSSKKKKKKNSSQLPLSLCHRFWLSLSLSFSSLLFFQILVPPWSEMGNEKNIRDDYSFGNIKPFLERPRYRHKRTIEAKPIFSSFEVPEVFHKIDHNLESGVGICSCYNIWHHSSSGDRKKSKVDSIFIMVIVMSSCQHLLSFNCYWISSC